MDTKKKKILIVEDEPVTALMLQQQLNEMGYETTHVINGEKAIEEVVEKNIYFNLILMDIDLGDGIDGIEATKRIIKKRDVPVVFISSHTAPKVVEKTAKLNTYGYITKNANITVIDASIKMAMNLFEAKKEIEAHQIKLKESEEKYRQITENISDVVWTADFDMNITFISKSAEKLFGESVEEYKKKSFDERFPKESMEIILAAFKEELIKEKNPKYPKDRTRTVELEHYKADKSLIWVSMHVSFLRDKDGKAVGIQGITRDISKEKTAELKLQESYKRNNALLEAIPDMMFVMDKNGVFLDFHSQSLAGLIENPADFIGKKAEDFLPEYLVKINNDVLERLFISKQTQEYSYPLEVNGEKRIYNARMVLLGDDKALSIVRDVTEKHLAEKELIQSHETYTNLLNNISEAVYIQNKHGVFLDVNETAARFYGFPKDNLIGKTPEFLGAPGKNDLNKLAKLHLEAYNGQAQTIEFWAKRADGSIFPKEVTLNAGYYFGKKVVIAVGRDISERKKAEQELSHSYNLMKYVIEHSRSAIAVHDKNLNYIYVSQRYIDDYKVADKNIIGKHHYEVFPDLPQKWREVHKKALSGEVLSSEEDKYIRADGSDEWTRWECRPWFESDGSIGGIIVNTEVITERKLTEQRILDSEEKFRLLFNNMTQAFALHEIITDDNNKPVDYRFLMANPAFEKLTGLKVKDIINKTVKEVLPKTEEHWIKVYGDVALKGKPAKYENFSVEIDKYFDTWSFSPKRGQFAVVFSDITSRKHAENALINSEEKHRLIFEKSPLGIFHFDKNGIMTECNNTFIKINGAEKKEMIIGMNLLKLQNASMTESIKYVLKGNSSSFEGLYTFVASNKTIPIRILFSPLHGSSGKIEGGVGLLEDRSALIQKENLEKQVEIARESVKFKQKFLANMSHEIRTPLTGMLGFTEMLAKTKLNKQQKEYLEILRHSGENLREIINLILDYSKIESGQVKLKTTAFASDELFVSTTNLFSSICHKDVELETIVSNKLPKYIKTDRQKLNQILNNLLSNAVKFTDKGKITLEASLLERIKEGNKASADDLFKIKIEITDTGIGISEKAQQSLFKPFSQIDSGDFRNLEGTGLGLSICKELTTILDGEIGVISEKGKGSSFWFTFIARKANQAETIIKPLKPGKAEAKDASLKILLVDDKKINLMVVSIMLNALGHTVETAYNGKEVLEKYKPGLFDIILMDIQMPEMDGITATRKLKTKYKNTAPIIGLSANAFEGDREKYMAMGMDEYLTKPVKSEDFEEMLKRLF